VNPEIINIVDDTAVVKCDSQLVQEAQIDTTSERDTNNRMEKRLKIAKKVPQKKIATVRIQNSATCSGCMGLAGNPLTEDEAAICAMNHWEIANKLFVNGVIDSAYHHCKRALSLYENGSLFYLKAKILNVMGKSAAALEAADISLGRSDHWRVIDREKSREEKCTALTSLYNKYPSTKSNEKLQLDCAEIGK